MHWHCDSHILRDEQPNWPMLADTALALVPNGTPDARLLIEERELAHNMGSQRLKDFTSGRHSAHIAQRLLGLNEQPVLRIDRSPQWPMGQCGSISHCRQWAFAGVSTGFRSIGVDVETIGRVTTKLYRTLFRPEEVTAMASNPSLPLPSRFPPKRLDTKRFSHRWHVYWLSRSQYRLGLEPTAISYPLPWCPRPQQGARIWRRALAPDSRTCTHFFDSGITPSMQALLGIIVLLALSWLMSENRRAISWRFVFTGIAVQATWRRSFSTRPG